MRSVVMGHQDDGAVGVGRAELGDDGGRCSLRQKGAQRPAPGRQIVGGGGADHARQRPAKEPPAP